MQLAGDGEPNSYFDADGAARALSQPRRAALAQAVDRAQQAVAPCPPQVIVEATSALMAIGARIVPGSPREQAELWAKGVAVSLSRIPADILLAALRKATFQQFRFLNEVGPWIDEETRDRVVRRHRVLNRLADIEIRARSMPAGPPEEKPLSAAEIAEANAAFERLGLRTRYADDGSEYQVPRASADQSRHTTPPRMPSAEDLAELKGEMADPGQAEAA